MAPVTTIPLADRERAVATLTLAFVNDPVVRWVFRDPLAFSVHWPRFIEAFGGRAFEHGSAHGIDDLAGVSLWLAPGVSGDDDAMVAAAFDAADTARPDLDGFFEQMDTAHPTFEHWYLPLTGVDPARQGGGLGSTLMRHGLQVCDRDRVPAYLEATSSRSRDLYLRHGFKVVGTIQHGASPPMWSMVRQPA